MLPQAPRQEDDQIDEEVRCGWGIDMFNVKGVPGAGIQAVHTAEPIAGKQNLARAIRHPAKAKDDAYNTADDAT
jgi:hypothetical protein